MTSGPIGNDMPLFGCIGITCCVLGGGGGDDDDTRAMGGSAFQQIFYTTAFVLLSVLSIVFRHDPPDFLERIPNLHDCRDDDNCLGAQQVLRLSFAGCVFFGFLGVLSTFRVRFHPILSTICLAGMLAGAQFIPNENIAGYAEFARVGSGVFLLLQLVLIMDFVYTFNDYLLKNEDVHWLLFALTAVMLAAFLAIIGLLYYYFAPHALCSQNIGFITSTLILAVLYTSASIAHPDIAHAGLFTSLVVAVYCITLTASALASEPDGHECKGFGHSNNDFSTIVGFVFTLVVVLASIIRASTRSSAFELGSSAGAYAGEEGVIVSMTRGNEVDDDGTNFTFFFVIFSLASMYFAMCLTSWQVDSVPDSYEIDKGSFSMWVKMCTSWAAAAMYTWTLVAPLVLTGRTF